MSVSWFILQWGQWYCHTVWWDIFTFNNSVAWLHSFEPKHYAIWFLVCHFCKVGRLLHNFGKWNISMHITSSDSFHLSTLAIHVRARCYTLSISKHGWIALLLICSTTIKHVLKQIFSTSNSSTVTTYAYFRNGLIDIANMHSWTACIITTTTANHLFCPKTSPIISNYQSISFPSSGRSSEALAVFSPGMAMSCRNTKSNRYSWSCWICSAWQIFVFETLGNGYLGGVLRLGCKGYRCTCLSTAINWSVKYKVLPSWVNCF